MRLVMPLKIVLAAERLFADCAVERLAAVGSFSFAVGVGGSSSIVAHMGALPVICKVVRPTK